MQRFAQKTVISQDVLQKGKETVQMYAQTAQIQYIYVTYEHKEYSQVMLITIGKGYQQGLK